MLVYLGDSWWSHWILGNFLSHLIPSSHYLKVVSSQNSVTISYFVKGTNSTHSASFQKNILPNSSVRPNICNKMFEMSPRLEVLCPDLHSPADNGPPLPWALPRGPCCCPVRMAQAQEENHDFGRGDLCKNVWGGYPSSHTYESEKWVPPIIVTFPWLWSK